MKLKFVFLSMCLMVIQTTFAGSYHVKVDGSSKGNGSNSNPWDLQTALNHPSIVKGGDTIWVHKGLYANAFVSNLKGSSNAPIIVRAIPGDEVIIDGKNPGVGRGSLTIEGQYAYYWGLTITNTQGVRVDGTGIMDKKEGVWIMGPNNKLINCIVHNNGSDGIGMWAPAIDSEVYGCIIYHNGFIAPDRGHGHGIYSQNLVGTKTIQDNILFNSFGLGIQIYTEGGTIQGYNIEGNIIFNSGIPANNFLERHILVGGYKPVDRILIKSNNLYNRPNYSSKASIQLGYGTADNIKAEVIDNYVVNGSFSVMKAWNNVNATGNTIATVSSSKQVLTFDDFKNIKSPLYSNNKYYTGKLDKHSNFDTWKSFSGQDKNSTYSSSLPTANHIVLRKNKYEKGRAHLVIYNWAKEASVKVDLSSVLEKDAEYKIYDVSNLSGGPIASGKYAGGSVGISMQLTKIELPFGNVPDKSKLIHTAPDFGTFLIVSNVSGSISAPPVVPVSIMPPAETDALMPMRIINYYPNPTVEFVKLEFYSPEVEPVTFSLFDSMGKLISTEGFIPNVGNNTFEIDLSAQELGIYIITVSNSKNKESCRVIKKM